jgi:segregation and condensation protein A
MASTLMYIKSRELLPKEQQVKPEEEEDDEDPRWELIRQLVEYKKFKDAAAQLQNLEVAQENTYARIPGKVEFEREPEATREDLSIFDLLNAVNGILKRFNEREPAREIFEDKWSVSEKIEMVRNLLAQKTRVRFSELFNTAMTRTEVVVTFLAMLELVKLKQVHILQPEDFGEIEISRAPAPQSATEAQVTPAVEPPAPVTETQPSATPTVVIEIKPPDQASAPEPTNPQFN